MFFLSQTKKCGGDEEAARAQNPNTDDDVVRHKDSNNGKLLDIVCISRLLSPQLFPDDNLHNYGVRK